MKKKSNLPRMLKQAIITDKYTIPLFFAYTLCAVVLPITTVALPKLLIGEIVSAAPRITAVLYIVLAYLLISGIASFFETYSEQVSAARRMGVRLSYVTLANEKLMSCDYKYAEDSDFLSSIERAMRSIDGNNLGVEMVYQNLMYIPSKFIVVVMLGIYIGMLSPIILTAVILHVAITIFVGIKTNKFEHDQKDNIGKGERKLKYYSRTSLDFDYGKDMRLYNLSDRLMSVYKNEIKSYSRIFEIIRRKEFLFGFLALFTMIIADGATYGLLTYKVINGLSVADYSSYVAAAVALTLALKSLSNQIISYKRNMLYANDLYEFLERDLNEASGTLPPAPKGETLDIELRDVSFKYPKTDKYIFEHLNLHIPSGQRIAVVGVNGAGKTTLVKLITGLFSVSEGEVLINGKNIKEYDRKRLYEMFSVVFQDVNILAYTIAENVACKLTDIDREKVIQSLSKVGLMDKINELPKGIDSVMLKAIDEDGIMLSGGQNQKLAIARALYKDANMVIMDEPTAALDALAEAEIYEEFSELVHGKTAVYISHRLSSTKFCDRIVLFDGVGIAEDGTHDQLMNNKSKYYEMFMTQGKYYREGKQAETEEQNGEKEQVNE